MMERTTFIVVLTLRNDKTIVYIVYSQIDILADHPSERVTTDQWGYTPLIIKEIHSIRSLLVFVSFLWP